MTILEFPTGEGRGPLAGGAASGRAPDYSDALARHAAHQTAELWRTQDALAETRSELEGARQQRNIARWELREARHDANRLHAEVHRLRAANRPQVAPETVAGEHTPPRRNLIDTLTLLWIGGICGLVLLTIAVYVITPAVDQLTR